MMRTLITRAMIVLFVVAVSAALCFAANVGKIAGKVVDKETGQSLPFTNVVIMGTAMGARVLSDGSYTILNVAPGTYDVRASFMGYKSVQVNGVVVKPDLTQTINFELEKTVVAELEPIIIQAERPVVEVDVTSTRNIFSAEDVKSLPVDNPVDVINYVSGSAVDRRGIHIRGGRAMEVGYYIDNASVQDPIMNTSFLDLTGQSVNEMVIFTGGFNAEYGNASSGIVNIITSEGTDKFHGSLEHRMYLPVEPDDPLNTSEARERINLSGPIVKTENADLKYAVAAEAFNTDDAEPRVEVLDRPGQQRLYDGGLTYRHGRTKIKGVFNIEKCHHISSYDNSLNRLYERILVPQTWRRTDRENYRLALNGTHMINERSFLDVSLSYLAGREEIAQPGRKWNPDLSWQQNQDLYHWNLDVQRDANNFIASGDNPYYDLRKNRIYAFRGSYTLQKGRNEFKTGLDVTTYDTKNDDIFASTQNYYIYTYDVKPRAGAAYLQDKLEFQGMIMNLGMRLDFFDPNHKAVKDLNHPYDNAPDSSVAVSLQGGPNNDWAPIGYDSTCKCISGLKDATVKWKLSPRLGVSHPITENSYLHFLYGHFFQMPSFNYLYQNEKWATKGRWMMVGNPDLEAEKTVSYEVGVNTLVVTNTSVDVTFFYKDITDMTETVTMGPTVAANPQDTENYVTYMNSGYANIRGFEINLKRPLAERWHYHAAYTFMVAKGFSSDINEGNLRRFDSENFPTQQFYLDWDRRHSFLLTGGYNAEGSWSANIAASYATGAPYTNPKTLSKKTSRNNLRFPSISNVDAEVHKYFTLIGLRADVFLRMTNLFDTRNVVNWDDTDQDFRNWLITHPGDYLGPFGDNTIYGPPRSTVGGIGVSF
jgi:outer membrane receptor for ferrienterochelin and colicin